MTRLRRRVNVALLVGNVMMTGGVSVQLLSAPDLPDMQPDALAQAQGTRHADHAADSPAPDEAGRADLMAEILARPLFSPTRRPEATAESAEPRQRPVRLVGVVLSGIHRFALVHVAGEPGLQRVAEGQQVGAYHIDRIQADRIRVRGLNGSREILLHPPRASHEVQPPPDPSSVAERRAD